MMSYYQKYRSEKVADLDLVSVRQSFETMMKSGGVAHAYLFVGPRGLGKTSAARILARLVNCVENNSKGKLNAKLVEPCGKCDACVSIKKGSAVDVMEIDAASHRGIDDIRDLRERANLVPAALAKKVYIIDEVHMLTTEAFNALLKTLEEPPAHVMFVLATTEAHKVPETIVSRCVVINFTKATLAELLTSFTRVVEGEGLKIEAEALKVLAGGLDGSFREGHKLLEQLANRFPVAITVENVSEILKLVQNGRIEAILSAAAAGEAEKIVRQMEELEAEGAEVINLVTKLLLVLQSRLRETVAEKGGVSLALTRLTRNLIRVVPRIKISPLPYLPLELVLVAEALRNRSVGGRRPQFALKESKFLSGEKKRMVDSLVDADGLVDGGVKVSTRKVEFDEVVSGWQELLSRLQPRNHSVAGLLRSARPKELLDKFLTIEVFYKFHKEQLDQEARRRLIEEEIAKLWGPISVKCVLGVVASHETSEKRVEKVEVSDGVALKDAEEIFGI